MATTRTDEGLLGPIQAGNCKAVSFPTFWRVWASHYTFMRFRAGSSHAQCTECLKHKLLIRSLGHHLTARSMQQKLPYNHLQSQFADRCTYWRKRGLSRARGMFNCCITDGMDQGKLAVPRHPTMKAKQFDSWNRPRLHLAAVVCHGWCLNLYLIESNMPKDSNTCMEMLSHTLSMIKKKVAPRQRQRPASKPNMMPSLKFKAKTRENQWLKGDFPFVVG